MNKNIRIGHGYDVHRLEWGRKLVLGGTFIPFEKGLLGHSDADAVAHAIMDSILGALALGDIGMLFPDSEDAYRDADSVKLLETCVEIMRREGYSLGNIDVTIVAQRPRLAPYIDSMRASLAGVFDTGKENISIKATTEEGLGFTGLGEGISAHCVCVLIPFEKQTP